ncbi:MAG: DNA polymerase/3'-5' exonuclease PolX [Peptococcaceae bacterium]|nr:DNA polymerase/3'-5' exonuclease PolX [Peptococcaceae bacterium]
MYNDKVADIFLNIARILEINNANPFRIRAYRNAAHRLKTLTEDISEIAKRGELEQIPGIGKDLAYKIREYLDTGSIRYYEELKSKLPGEILDFLNIPGIGPRLAETLYYKLNITSINELEKKARNQQLRGVKGIKSKTEDNILRGIKLFREGRERYPLGYVLPYAEKIRQQLCEALGSTTISLAGSIRRRKTTVKDIDILVASDDPAKVVDVFLNLVPPAEILAKGSTKTSIITEQGYQIDLRVVSEDSYGAALCYFTGSKLHNIRIRELALKKGLKINEYGVYKDGHKIAGATETEVYDALGLAYIPPEIREDVGEIEAVLQNQIPTLVKPEDIKGDLHVHSKYSDGTGTIEEIAAQARALGLEWVAVCDHSKSLRIAKGLTEEDLRRKISDIRSFNDRSPDIKLLCGTEVDILPDGRLDYPDNILAELDFVIAAVHSAFKQDRTAMTERLVKAARHPLVHSIAHPTGRLFGEREAYDVDIDRIIETCSRHGTALEINAYPKRLDLDGPSCRLARKKGVRLTIGSDAHLVHQMNYLSLGVAAARRGWLIATDVLNTLSYNELRRFLQK